jgi:hypothetical protein
VNQIQNFPPAEVIAFIKAPVHLAHELQVFCSIYRPTVAAEISRVVEQGNPKTAWRGAYGKLRLIADSSTPS